MNTPPKKLSSSPIVINTPNLKPEIKKTDNQKLDKKNPENDSTSNGILSVDSNTSVQNEVEKSRNDVTRQDNAIEVQGTEKFVPRKYDRVSMRILAETKKKLIELKTETSIPYEVIVDVMIRNWDALGDRAKSKILKLAQAERNHRLIEGKHKSIKTSLDRLK